MPRSCSSCNSPNEISDDAKFCPTCGARVADAPDPARSVEVAASGASAANTEVDGGRVFAARFVAADAGEPGVLGQTYDATDLQHDNSAVRLVVVSEAALPSSALAERALREWKQLSKLTSPRVLRVVDQGRLDDGKIYVASARPAGCSLDQLIAAEGPLSIERARRIVSQIGEALTEAQKLGVIHRDVSPHNVHVDGDEVTVAEFALAEAVNDKVYGTPAFLSPEQAEGKPVDQRSNIYSLGALVYYMLTGAAPFSGDAASLLSQHVSATPKVPSSKRPGLPAELDRIVMKALEKSAGRRHLTLRQLITEIEAVPHGAAVVRSEELGRAKTLAPDEDLPAPPAEMATVLGMAAPTMAEIQAAAAANAPKTAPQAAVTSPAPVRSAAPDAQAKTMMAPAADAQPTAPAPVIAATPVASAATMMAEAPRAPAAVKPVVPSSPVVQAPKKSGGGFRETAWFKQGEIDEELAKQEAAVATADPLAPTGTTGKHAAVDPASLDAQDSKRLSLKTGATQVMAVIKSGSGAIQAMPGDRMDEADMIAEIDQSKRWFTIAGVIVAVAVLALVIVLATRKSEPDAPAKKDVPSTPKAAGPVVPAAPSAERPAAEQPTAEASPLAEAEAALAKGDFVVTVDAVLRASRDGVEPQRVASVAAAAQRALAVSALKAKKRKDRAGEAEVRALAAKLAALAPVAAPAGKKAPGRTAVRR